MGSDIEPTASYYRPLRENSVPETADGSLIRLFVGHQLSVSWAKSHGENDTKATVPLIMGATFRSCHLRGFHRRHCYSSRHKNLLILADQTA